MKLLTRVDKSISINMLMTISLLLASFVLLASHANAQGVAAGTIISNTVVVSYQMGNQTGSLESLESIAATNTFVIAETINATLTSLDASNVIVPTPATDKILSWVLTNTGNGTESFLLTSIDTLITDDFNPSVQTLWIETNNTPGLQNTDTLYQAGNSIQLVSDQSQTIYIKSNIPAGLIKTQVGSVELVATSTTTGIANSTIGSSISGAGDGGTDAVVLINDGHVDSTGSYGISTVELQLTKSVTKIVDPFSGTDVMSQSLITYQIDVNATGDSNDIIENLIIEDATPANMQFLPGSIKLNGNTLTDSADSDGADFDITHNNTVTLHLGDIPTPSNHIITITYTIN
ncbi:MAG: hypothetical protein V3U84_02460 [Thiotrichaceae bacterium]